MTVPNKGLYETTFTKSNDTFDFPPYYISVTNQYGDVPCVENPFLRLYCDCKTKQKYNEFL